MAHINPQEIRIIGQEAKNVAFLACGRFEIQTVGRDSMGRFVERPLHMQSGSLSPSRHTPGTAEPIPKGIAFDSAICLSGIRQIN